MRNALCRLIPTACVALLLSAVPALAQSHRWPWSPCEIQGICTFKDAVTEVDAYGSAHVTLVDDTGHIFIVAYLGPGVIFKRQDGKETKSKPGSAEEQCLLAVLKRSYAAAFPKPLPKEPFENAGGKKKYGTQYTVNHLIGIFQRRCATRQEWNFRDS